MSYIQFLCNLLVALGLGSMIGLERQLTGRTIGIRTNVLVCMGACIFTSFPFCIGGADVLRMSAPIVSGVGFLGSGIIFKDGSNVRGINTAAIIWCTAGVGILTGAGLYGQALLSAVCLVAVNLILRPLSGWLGGHGIYNDMGYVYRIFLTCPVEREKEIRREILRIVPKDKIYVLSLSGSVESENRVRMELKFFYKDRSHPQSNEDIVEELLRLDMIHGIGWEMLD